MDTSGSQSGRQKPGGGEKSRTQTGTVKHPYHHTKIQIQAKRRSGSLRRRNPDCHGKVGRRRSHQFTKMCGAHSPLPAYTWVRIQCAYHLLCVYHLFMHMCVQLCMNVFAICRSHVHMHVAYMPVFTHPHPHTP